MDEDPKECTRTDVIHEANRRMVIVHPHLGEVFKFLVKVILGKAGDRHGRVWGLWYLGFLLRSRTLLDLLTAGLDLTLNFITAGLFVIFFEVTKDGVLLSSKSKHKVELLAVVCPDGAELLLNLFPEECVHDGMDFFK
jgi:hypothetical protein